MMSAALNVKSLDTAAGLWDGPIGQVHLLGHDAPLPPHPLGRHAFKITR